MTSLKPKTFVLDLDGVFTSGAMIYSRRGKIYKLFGPDDHDALKLMQAFLDIQVVTADRRGYAISRKRIEKEMKIPLSLVPGTDRLSWISERFDPSSTVYMGDGIFDHTVFKGVMYSISTPGALDHTRLSADFVTRHDGGNRAIAEACIHVSERFFENRVFPDMVI